MDTILNVTQHDATSEQIAAGVVEPPVEVKLALKRVLTFDEIPSSADLYERAEQILSLIEDIVPKRSKIMIGGAPYLMGQLERVLEKNQYIPVYAFSKRVVEAERLENGNIKKTTAFKHEGFIVK